MKKLLFLLVPLAGLLFILAASILIWNPLSCFGPEGKSRHAAVELDRLDLSLDVFSYDTGAYPVDLSELLDSDRRGWDGPYIISESLRDPWNNPVVYAASATGEYYLLLSFGADGKPGGSGVNADIVSHNSGPGS